VPEFREALGQDSEFWEKCARHTNKQTTRAIQSIYLCDDCAMKLTAESFNNRPPIHHGDTLYGYCGLCNDLKDVTCRFWFVCPICWNVIVAYQKGFVSAKSVHAYWECQIKPHFPELTLLEKEEIYLSAFSRAGKTKKQAATTLEILDFLVVENRPPELAPLFHIELKSGPGAIEQMREFQLDINDSNDIIGTVNNTKLPAYIFHVQLQHKYLPPTRSTEAIGMWCTDIFTLLENKLAERARRGEDKNAGYYSPRAFRPISEFVEQIRSKRYQKLAQKVIDEPLALS
jgi:hypothetical protein